MVTGVSEVATNPKNFTKKFQQTTSTEHTEDAVRILVVRVQSAVVLDAVGNLAEGEDHTRRPDVLREEGSGASVEKMCSLMSASTYKEQEKH